MIRHLIAVFSALSLGFLSVVLACAQEVGSPIALTNDDVIKMVQAKVSDEVIVSVIKSSRSRFDTRSDAIIKLKTAGVSDAAIRAMVESSGTAGHAANGPQPNPNDPRSPHDAGIYWFGQGQRDPEPHLNELEPALYSANLGGGMFKSSITYGIAKTHMKAVVRGGKANLRVNEALPEFWFYFDQKSQFGAVGDLSSASSPNEFILARMQAKSDARELTVGEVGLYGTSSGTRPKDTVEFKFQKIAAGIYRVTPINPLQPGEYCFFEADINFATGQNGGKLFDFGINPAQ